MPTDARKVRRSPLLLVPPSSVPTLVVSRGPLPRPRAGRRPSTDKGEAAGEARWVGANPWGNVANLPAPLNDGMGLFRAALTKKVIVVPGEFFDVNPGKRRHGRASRFREYVRFSFGPSLDNVERALTRLEELVASPPSESSLPPASSR